MPISGKFPTRVARGGRILADDFNYVSNELRRLGSIGDASEGMISTGAGIFRRGKKKTKTVSSLQIIRFKVISGSGDSVLASAESKSCGLGNIPGDDSTTSGTGSPDGVVEIFDPSLCFFDEAAVDLVDRYGFAAWLELTTSGVGSGSPDSDCRWEVFSLCCPP